MSQQTDISQLPLSEDAGKKYQAERRFGRLVLILVAVAGAVALLLAAFCLFGPGLSREADRRVRHSFESVGGWSGDVWLKKARSG